MSKQLIIALVFILLISCKASEEQYQSPVIAHVNGIQINEDMLLEFADVSDIKELPEQQRRKKLDELIKLTILAGEADARMLTAEPLVKARLEIAERSVKANLFLSSVLHSINPTEAELFNYFQIHKGRYQQEREEYRIQRIFVPTEALADSISRAIVNNRVNFGEAARRYSTEAARETEGYIGYLTPEEMDANIRRAVANLGQWRYTKIRSNGGFYLVRYTEKRTRSGEKNFTDVIDEIREEYINEQKSEFVANKVRELMNKAEIIITK